MKTITAILGIVITIAGWLISNAERYTFVYRLLTPNFYDALYVSDILKNADFTKDHEFRIDEKGYSSLHGYVSKYVTANEKSLKELGYHIKKITLHLKPFAGKKLGGMAYGTKGTNVNNFTYLSVEFEDGNSKKHSTNKVSFNNLDKKLIKFYSDNRFHTISDYIFWVGIAITCFSLIVDRKENKKSPL